MNRDEVNLAKLDETIDAIRDFIKANGYPPSITELSERLGIGRTAVYNRVEQLVKAGWITKGERNQPRTLRIVE